MEKTLLLFLGAASLSLAAAAQVRETEEAFIRKPSTTGRLSS